MVCWFWNCIIINIKTEINMIIKNYCNPKPVSHEPYLPPVAANLQIIEDVTNVFVHAGCFNPERPCSDGNDPTTYYGTENQPMNTMTRWVDFTRYGVRCRLVVTDRAYVCNDEGKTVEKVSC